MTSAFAQELRFALNLVEVCGARALEARRAAGPRLVAESKPADGSPVTAVDRELDERIVSALRAAFPTDAILAEESGGASEERLRRDRCWMIDPIDGTSDYVRGTTNWAIHVGLVVEGAPRLGIVAEPAAGRVTWGVVAPAERGGGAWTRDGSTRVVHVSSWQRGPVRIAGSVHHRSPWDAEIVALLGATEDDVRRVGSTGVKMAMVSRGEVDAYVHANRGTKLWDSAAPHAIVRAAGGEVTDCTGAPIEYLSEDISHPRGLVAASMLGVNTITERLGPHAHRWFSALRGR